ncbi:MAG: hypothetical protein NT019_02445 [Candidatus Adlerbacteria bacterium]|nr:hypothetical protein [Candidatus Adlerbacteria bacterium]
MTDSGPGKSLAEQQIEKHVPRHYRVIPLRPRFEKAAKPPAEVHAEKPKETKTELTEELCVRINQQSENLSDGSSPTITLEAIKREVLQRSGLSIEEFEGIRRTRRLARPRQVFAYFAYMCGQGYIVREIGEVCKRHYTTVLNSIEEIESLRCGNVLWNDDTDALELLEQLCQHFKVSLPKPKPSP